MLGAGAGPAGAAPTEHEYELLLPTPDGEGEDPAAQVGPGDRAATDDGDVEATLPTGSTSAADAPSTPTATAPAKAVPMADERPGGTRGNDQGESPLKGRTFALAPPDAAIASTGTATSAGGIPPLLLVLSGIALLVAAAGVWRLRRRSRA